MKIVYEQIANPIHFELQKKLGVVPHFHKEIELIYVEKGSAVALADNKKYKLQKDDLFIAFPNQIHCYEKCVEGSYLAFIISPSVFFGTEKLFKTNLPEGNKLSFKNDAELKRLFRSVMKTKSKYSTLEQSGYLNLAMNIILPKLRLSPQKEGGTLTLHRVAEYCGEHFTEEISLGSVADALGLSKYYISRLFNNNLGISFSDFVNSLRIEYACRLIASTDKKIADISLDAGFSTIRSFNRAFSDIMKMTPHAYRNSLK